ncbi:glycosyltransferase family 4 protein [Sphingomonas suaedae]|uniref:Glycosyltransferase family 4 protein n=1 Tax=Sphingomonas suaedae TaxID=2599297 RepID=A0A518RE16_9SPHN|nr:glycosyltransferase [Sphingomonas suaedae]QDX25715.1 glycosyltransferase family 4 protein [Sphingomonas suaedae]
MLRVLTLSSLYPDASRPNFGVFVERQTLGLAAHPDVELKLVAPIGVPPWPLSRMGHYAALSALPAHEVWKGVETWRPRFPNLPGTGGRFHARMLTLRLKPLLRRIRRDFAFDVIDASFFFPDGVAAVALSRAFGVPVSIKARGADIHHWGHSSATGGQVIAAGVAADGLLAVSDSMRTDMVALGMDAAKIRVHRTGVDLDRFAPRDRAAAKAALGIAGPLVASVGALIPRKGHEIVIEAMAALPGVRLMIAGEGPERPRLAAQIARLGLSDRVTLIGSVAHDTLPDLLTASDVMALASSSEGLANAWVEALASGTPVVIPDAGGARELVTAPDHGRIVARTAAAFAEAIGGLIAEPPSSDAVRTGAAGFTWEANSAALYDHLVGLVRG